MAIIPSFYLNSVVAIGVRADSGAVSWVGTGFFVGRSAQDNPQKVRPFLVTNKHVFFNRNTVVIRMKIEGTEELQMIDVPLKDAGGNLLYQLHEDANIDIAVLQINAKFIENSHLEFQCFNIYDNAMTSTELRNQGVDEGSIIYMLGFPMGLVNEKSNVPLCRMGCISRMSEIQIREQHNMLVDIQNFPGNSGSPIISRPEIISIKGTPSLSKCVLIGIVHSYIPYHEKLINSQTNQVVEIKSENSGIANAHPVEYIRDIIDRIHVETM